jgi:ATP-binding cassette subfamily B (MDR/TAP) protein 1
VESIQNIRTVVQLTKEDYFYNEYCGLIKIPYRYCISFYDGLMMIVIVYYRSAIKRANLFGVFFGFTNSVMFFSLAALFRLGAYLLQNNKVTFLDVLL